MAKRLWPGLWVAVVIVLVTVGFSGWGECGSQVAVQKVLLDGGGGGGWERVEDGEGGAREIFAGGSGREGDGEREVEFAIGVEITASYGTAAIRWRNGTFTDVVKIEGNGKFKEAMRWYGDDANMHLHPPYKWFDEPPSDYLRVLLRRIRKKLGLPATPQIGPLSSLIASLHDHATIFLRSHSLPLTPHLVLARPLLNALYAEDIRDALEYVSLPSEPSTSLCKKHEECTIPLAPWGAYVGHGYGLCTHFSNTELCDQEMSVLPPRTPSGRSGRNKTLVVTWTEDMLQITHRDMAAYYHETRRPSTYPRNDTVRWDLSTAEIPERDSREWIGRFWDYLFDRVGIAMEMQSRVEPVVLDKVLLVGDGMGREWEWEEWRREGVTTGAGLVIKALKQMFWELGMEDEWKGVDVRSDEAVFVGARGAAEYAYRWESGYE
ncbi:hypothetical protein B0J11DRAFT_593605 [Dendryphion nanum]|uniref:Uncharacterized protein n=1 Tax=Dendryphion nanum TaxID=256645 RepID=A0A9P9ICN4_9PLEO|nr:hypothetical protein B0J11DRAFT_593605 [Dendryphion nanum]